LFVLRLCVVWNGKTVKWIAVFEAGFHDFAGQALRNLNGFGDRASFGD